MKRILLVGVLAACGPGSQDAPRPVMSSEAQRDFRGRDQDMQVIDDDDNDGIANDHDSCPLAYEPYDDPHRDGCPEISADAGVARP
jgi:hypothetical protein